MGQQRDSNVLVKVIRAANGGVGVTVMPVVVGEEEFPKSPITDRDLLTDLIYGLSTLIREIEERNPENKGKIMGEVVKTMGDLYVEPELFMRDEEFVRSMQQPGNKQPDNESGAIGGNS